MPNWLKFPIVLIIVALISAVSLTYLNKATEPAREKLAKDTKESALKIVLPDATEFKNKSTDLDEKPFEYLEGYKDGQLIGYVAEGRAAGYSSILEVMVGIDKGFKIVAIKVLSQKETPGLGDKVKEVLSKKTIVGLIEGKKYDEAGLRPWFQVQFDAKTVPVKVKKDGGDIEAITGATISSRAVCDAVNKAVEDIKKALEK